MDTTIHLGDVILALITLIFLPFIKTTYTTITSMRDTVKELQLTVGEENPPTGLHLRINNVERNLDRRRVPRDK